MLRVLRAEPELPTWLSSLVGPDKFCRHLHALGRDANAVRVPTSPSRRSPSPVAPRHLVFLAPGSPVQLISLRSSRGNDGRVAMAHHYVIPVDPDRTGPETYATRLGQAFGGITGRTRTRLSFVGGWLADRLRDDDFVRRALFNHLAAHDDVRVVPDLGRGLVRIVHVHQVSARRPLFVPEPSAFYERLLPEPLLAAFERTARHILAAPSADSPTLVSTVPNLWCRPDLSASGAD